MKMKHFLLGILVGVALLGAVWGAVWAWPRVTTSEGQKICGAAGAAGAAGSNLETRK